MLPALAEYRVGSYVEPVTVLAITPDGGAAIAHADGTLNIVSIFRCRLLRRDELP